MPRPGFLLPIALLLLIGVLWGGFYSLIKTGVTGGVHPTNYLFWFTLGSAVCLYGAGLVRGRRLVFARAHLGYYMKLGFVRFTLANIILYSVQAKLPVGLMAVIMSFVPIFTYGLSLIARIERFVWSRIAGLLFGFAGVLLIVVPRGSLPDPALTTWALLGLAAPFLHALAYVALSDRARPAGVDSLTLGCGTLFAGALFSLPVALLAGEFRWVIPPFSTGELALIAHCILGAVNFYAIFELIRIAGPVYMSQSNFLSVGFGVLLGILLFDERFSALVWAAMGFILVGVFFVNLRRA